jgi:iron complex outermembrane receptor protein
MHFMKIQTFRAAVVVLAGWTLCGSLAQPKPMDLTELSLEELMNIEVTLVSKRPEKMTDAAAAVYVLTQDDIRRSGVTNLPDALRLVPGVQVARIDENKWAISSRGFNDLFANKLLVLIDGRSVYSPIFSGVFWEAQDVFLRDIDRIEVVRGPGATLWGANAVNGIINIITKKSQDTQGGLIQLGSGTEEKRFSGFRYGGKMGEDASYRIYAKYFKVNNSVFENTEEAKDGWSESRGGFRMDWNVKPDQSIKLQGDFYGGETGQTILIPVFSIRSIHYNSHISGGNVLAKWTRAYSSTSEVILQLYVDRLVRRDTIFVYGSYNTYDVDFQHRFLFGKNHSLIWGLGFRQTRDQFDASTLITFIPQRKNYDVASAFFQDEMSLCKDRLRIVLGSKFEHNDFTGFEYQPSFRMLWKPGCGHSVWGAASRAIRTPTRVEHDAQSPLIRGNPQFQSEEVEAFELGYHHQSSKRFHFDVSAFNNLYRHLRVLELTYYGNKKSAKTCGFETSLDWSITDWWTMRGNYSNLRIWITVDKDSKDQWGKSQEQESPRHQFTIRSSIKLPGKTDLDLCGRYVSKLPSPNLNVPSYFEVDANLGWRPTDYLELSLTGRNLLKRYHPEFTANWLFFAATQVQRSVYGGIAVRF